MYLSKEGHLSKRHHRSHRADNTARNFKTNNFKENIIDINSYRKPIKQTVILLPKNKAQEKYIDSLENPDINIVFGYGYAGTGKTYLATLYAIQCLKQGTIDKIVITRPNVAVDDRDIGYLPGDILKKMSPWVKPILDVFEEYYSVKEIAQMIEENVIELVPLAYIRGRTFKNSIILLDEAQNTTPSSMLSALTRIGDNSKMIITGDTKQSDRGKINGLSDFLNRFNDNPRIAVCYFDKKSIERHPVITDVLKLYGEEI